MTDEQYSNFHKYARVTEFVWNTTYHNTIKATPFEAAHGLAARTPAIKASEQFLTQKSQTMTPEDIDILSRSAAAFRKGLHQLRQEDKQATADRLNEKGHPRKYQVGDRVAFCMPPSEAEA